MEVVRIMQQIPFIKDCKDDGCQQVLVQPSEKGTVSKAKAKVPAEEAKTPEKQIPSANSKGRARTKKGDEISPVDTAPMEMVAPRTPKVTATKYKPGQPIISVSQGFKKTEKVHPGRLPCESVKQQKQKGHSTRW